MNAPGRSQDLPAARCRRAGARPVLRFHPRGGGAGRRAVQTGAAPRSAALRDELIARGEPYARRLARGKAVRMALDQVMSDESGGRCARAARSLSFRR